MIRDVWATSAIRCQQALIGTQQLFQFTTQILDTQYHEHDMISAKGPPQ